MKPIAGGPTDLGREFRLPLGVAGARVLVVARDPEFLAAVDKVARSQLLDVARVTRGQALNRAFVSTPDAVIIELADEGADFESLQLASRLHELPGCEGLAIAFTSQSDSFSLRRAAADAGGSLFLAQPIEADSLGLSFQQLLAIRGAAAPRVLLVLDGENGTSTPGIASALAHGNKLVSLIRDPSKVFDVLGRTRPDLLLIDAPAHKEVAIDLCRVLRSHAEWQDLPTFVVVGDDAHARVQALRAGADEILVSPIDHEVLEARIDARLERMRMLRERFDKDALTGLPLRRPFLSQLSRSIAECVRHGRPICVALLDVDLFKTVNDRHGHLIADGVLAALGRLLSTRFRTEDLSGRWGGEEFVLAFPGQPSPPLRALLTRVLDEFGSIPFKGKNGEEFHVTFSAGMSSCPHDGHSVQDLLDAADRRLYSAKRGGRAQVAS
jgi:diguanylate cyclase (GGDEF)-like protein